MQSIDPDDPFAASRMSFGDHIEELRWHMSRTLAGFGAIVALVFVIDSIGYATGTPIGVGKPVMDLISAPVEAELQKFYDRRAERLATDIREGRAVAPDETVEVEIEVNQLARELAPLLGATPPAEGGEKYVRLKGRGRAPSSAGPRPNLKAMSISEAMVVYFQVALGCGVVLGSPWLFWQAWSFVASGLYRHERRGIQLYLPFSLGLFLAGVLLCQFAVIPRAIEAMLWFNEWLDIDPDLRLGEWLGFAVLMPLIFGLAFQTPLVMLFLERVGIINVETFRQRRRLAWFLMAIFAGLITPSTEVYSLLLLWMPMSFLYELGILLCRLTPRRKDKEAWEEAEAESAAEV